MCNPAVAMIAVSAASAAYSGYQQNQQAKFQAKVEENNATAAKYEADNVRKLGEAEMDAVRKQAAAVRAAGTTGYATAGVQLGTGGSPLSWDLDVTQGMNEDLDTVKYNTATRLWGIDMDRRNSRAQSALNRMAARNAATSGILNTAGTVASGYYSAKKDGYFK